MGLSSAANIMQFINDTARSANIIVVATIHQPSSSVFYSFDKVMLLSQGKVAYVGAHLLCSDRLPVTAQHQPGGPHAGLGERRVYCAREGE